jgi:hypothetical protein
VYLLYHILKFSHSLSLFEKRPNDEWVKQTCWSSSEDNEPLGQLAVHAVMHLLFLPGFTVELGSFQDVISGEDKYASELNHATKEGDNEVRLGEMF